MFRVTVLIALLLNLSACSSIWLPSPPPERKVEYYPVVKRQAPPQTVYSRVMWSHLPAPATLQSKEKTPLLQPVMHFDLAKSNLAEALEALAQTIGYRLQYPAKWSKRPISIELTGTVEEALAEVARQAGVSASLDHELRLVKVAEKGVSPSLPRL